MLVVFGDAIDVDVRPQFRLSSHQQPDDIAYQLAVGSMGSPRSGNPSMNFAMIPSNN
jgi:hypothetical protein